MKWLMTMLAVLGILVSPGAFGLSMPVASAASVDEHHVLVAYFSWGGNTRRVAELIQSETGGTLFAIEPVEPYPTDSKECHDVASREMATKARPAIRDQVENMADYDVVFIGYPIWWSNAPMIIDTFLESYDFDGKTIIPFCTSGKAPVGVSMDKIRLHCPNSTVLDGLTANQIEDVKPWIESLGLKK